MTKHFSLCCSLRLPLPLLPVAESESHRARVERKEICRLTANWGGGGGGGEGSGLRSERNLLWCPPTTPKWTEMLCVLCFDSRAKVFDMRMRDLDPDVGQTGTPRQTPPPPSLPPAEVKVLLLLPVIKMLPKCCSARQICCCFCCCRDVVVVFHVVSGAVRGPLSATNTRTHFKNVDTQHRAIKFIFHSFDSPPVPDAESDSQSGHSWQPCWNRVTYCVALHSTSDSTSLASNFQLNEFTFTKYLFVWYFYFPHWSRIQSHLWFEFADDNRIMDLRGKLIEFVCMAMNNY